MRSVFLLLPILFVLGCGRSTQYCASCNTSPSPSLTPAPVNKPQPPIRVVATADDMATQPTADLAAPDMGTDAEDLAVLTDMTQPTDLSESDDPECTCDMEGHGKGLGHCNEQHELNSRGHGNGHCKYDCQ